MTHDRLMIGHPSSLITVMREHFPTPPRFFTFPPFTFTFTKQTDAPNDADKNINMCFYHHGQETNAYMIIYLPMVYLFVSQHPPFIPQGTRPSTPSLFFPLSPKAETKNTPMDLAHAKHLTYMYVIHTYTHILSIYSYAYKCISSV